MTTQQYSNINKRLAEMCALDFRPISIVNGEGFKRFVQALNPNYSIPSHTTIRNYVHRSYVEAKQQIKSIISKAPSVSLTTDLWTSHATQSYITVTCHYLLDDWTLSSQVLATKHVTERHTGANIAEEVRSIIDDYSLQDVACITHDNAANMELAMQHLGLPHLGCAGHTLQLCVHDGLKLPELSKTLARCRNIVAYFHRSVLANDALEKRQKQENPNKKPLSLIQDVSTRWNSTFFLLERLIALRIPLYGVLYDLSKEKDAKSLEITDNDWSIAEGLVQILKPLKIATQTISGEDYTTLGNVYPIISSLIASHLNDDIDVPGSVKKCRKTIRESLRKRFHIGHESNLVLAASALNPLHKKLSMFAAEKQQDIKHFLRDEIAKIKQSQDQSQQNAAANTTITVQVKDEPDSPSCKKAKISDQDVHALKFLMGDYFEIDSDDDDDEVENYFSEKRSKMSPLEGWKLNCHRYGYLSRLAKRYLQIPATSTPSERVFSSAGHTVLPNRSSLDPNTVDQLVFLHSALATKGSQKSCNLPDQQASSDHQPTCPKAEIKQEAQDSGQEVQEHTADGNPPLPSLPDI